MKSITVQQLRERAGTPLIDVREVDEFAAGHVPGRGQPPDVDDRRAASTSCPTERST